MANAGEVDEKEKAPEAKEKVPEAEPAAKKAPDTDAKAKATEAEAKAPEAKAKAPEAKAPEAKAPEAKAPEGKAPEAKAKAPEAKAKAPEAKAKDAPRPAAAAHGAAEGHVSHTAKYLKVFAALIVLTGLELGVVYAGLERSLVIIMLIALALTKAGFVALWFMHLADERPVLRRMVGLPLLFPPFYACVLIAEAIFRSTLSAAR